MNITDEQLSAFLDGELPNIEMETIRAALVDDETLADRLAELAMVDELVAASAREIDSQPLPQAVESLFQQTPVSAQIIEFPLWKSVRQSVAQGLRKPAAIAASVALVVGLGVTQVMLQSPQQTTWASVAKVLETSPSGVLQLAENGMQIKPRLSFKNHQGEFCRQFDMNNQQEFSENIACRQAGRWQLVFSLASQQKDVAGDFVPASGGSALDNRVDEMLEGDILEASAEQSALATQWSIQP